MLNIRALWRQPDERLRSCLCNETYFSHRSRAAAAFLPHSDLLPTYYKGVVLNCISEKNELSLKCALPICLKQVY